MTTVLESATLGSVKELVADVLGQGSFDATEPQALEWLSRRQRKLCARSRCFRKRISLGLTEAGVQDYALPVGIVEIFELQVAGAIYGVGRHSDIANGAGGRIWATGGLGVRDDDEGGSTSVALYPIPTDSGQEVAVFAACLSPDLDVEDDSTLVIPPDFYDALASGAIATALARVESRPDLAAPFEADFETACRELRRQTNRKFRAGPAQIRVVGVNA